MASLNHGQALLVGDGPSVTAADLPASMRRWPDVVKALWIQLSMGRRWNESAEAVGIDKSEAWMLARNLNYRAEFDRILDDNFKALAEPAHDLLELYLKEGAREDASEIQKDRGLRAVSEALKHVRAVSPRSPHTQVSVHVSGAGAAVAIDLGGLLAEKPPLPSKTVGGMGGEWDVEAEVVTVEATQPRRAKTSSQRTAEERERERAMR